MSRVVTCNEHGAVRPAYVCWHLRLTLRDDAPRGVIWMRDDDGCVNAYCDACNAELKAAGGEWNDELEAAANVTLVCEGCFHRVLSINGKTELN